jgi:hypothetical protein
MSLPTGYDERKNFPLLTFLTAYFPDAIEAMVALSVQGNVQHEVDSGADNPFKLPGDKITWDRRKSKDELNTAMRHMWDHARALRGGFPDQLVDVDGHLHIVKAAWRACAEAQKTIEQRKLGVALARTDVGEASEEWARGIVHGPIASSFRPQYIGPVPPLSADLGEF